MIKKIEGTFVPKDQVDYATDSIVSREIVHNQAGNITFFAFDAGQALSEHTAPFDAIAQILDGNAEIHIQQTVHKLTVGDMLVMPANVPHAVYAKEKFKMMLIMIKG